MAYNQIRTWLQNELKTIEENGLFKHEKQITTPQGAQIQTTEGENINFCANNYLGLANHPDLVSAAEEGLKTYG